MLESHKIYLQDRIKETSYTIGTSNFTLNGAANGFSSFGSVYENGDNVFYAATDGTFYEVGSGVYVTGVQNSLVRFPFRSSNNNNKVSFGEGIKEIFVTYPATNSVYSASGLNGYSFPQDSGIAFWSASNILHYDPNIIWDFDNKRLGVRKTDPQFTIDVGGDGAESIIKSSGLYIGASGIIFPSGNNGDLGYGGGRQVSHYVMNVINNFSGLGSVIELSGEANHIFRFKKQNAGLVLAGPASGCTPPCSPDYPSFRPLFLEDISDVYVDDSGVSINPRLGINTERFDGRITSYTNDMLPNTSGTWINAAYTASGLYGGGIALVDTTSSSAVAQSGYSIYTSGNGIILNIGVGSISGLAKNILSLDTSLGSGNVNNSTMNFFGQKLRIQNSKTPASGTAIGNSGDICWDNNYIYVCVAPNTWKRSFISTW